MDQLRISSKLSLHGNPNPAGDVSEYIYQGLVFMKKMGFDAADFPMKALFPLMGDDWERIVTKAAEDAEQLGIKFEVCHLPYGVKVGGTPEEVAPFNESVHRGIEAAKILGVDYAVVHPNTITTPLEEFDHQKLYDSVMEHLSPFADHAAKVGLDLAVENMRLVHKHYPIHRYCGTPDELCEIADALGVGVCWDFGHANINGIKQSEALAYIGSRLKVLHVNDNYAGNDIHLAPFCGNLDWADAMKGLSAVGFKGLLNYELETRNQPAAVREDYARYLINAAHELMALM